MIMILLGVFMPVLAIPKSQIYKIEKISETLYRGKTPSVKTFIKLKNIGIKDIIDLRGNKFVNKSERLKEKILCKLFKMNYKNYPSNFRNGIPNKDYYINLAKEIKTSGEKTYVHCKCGMHRANYAVRAVEIINEGKNFDTVEKEMKNSGILCLNKNLKLRIRMFLGLFSEEKFENNSKMNFENFKKMFCTI